MLGTGSALPNIAYNQAVPGFHSDVHDWYTQTVSNGAHEGFYWSLEGDGGTLSRPAYNDSGPAAQLYQTTPATNFTTQAWYGTKNVLENGTSARLFLSASGNSSTFVAQARKAVTAAASGIPSVDPGYLWTYLTVPSDASFLRFDMTWINVESDDYLTLHFENNLVVSFLASDFNMGDTTNSGLIPIDSYTGQSGQLLFGLHAGTAGISDVTISDLEFISVPEPHAFSLLASCISFIIIRRRTMRFVVNDVTYVPQDVTESKKQT
jgi:hypothetical protein